MENNCQIPYNNSQSSTFHCLIRRFFILLLLILLLGYSLNDNVQGQDKKMKYVINGSIKGIPDSTIFYLITDNNGRADSVSTYSHKEEFVFRGVAPNIGKMYFIKLDTTTIKLKHGGDSYCTFIIDGPAIRIIGTLHKWPDVMINGSIATKEYMAYLQAKKQPLKEMNDVFNAPNVDSMQMRLAEERYRKFIIDYLGMHHNSFYAPLLTLNAEGLLGYTNMKMVYDKLPENVKMGFYGSKLRDRVFYLKNKENIVSNNTAIGKGTKLGEIAPEIKGYTSEGVDLSLSQIVSKGKLTLLDFWASWCGPCRAELPNIREVYGKYHEKGFNVLSISIDKDPKAWKKALEEEKLPWYNISDMDAGQNSLAKDVYNVSYIPRTFLIDSTGRIIAIRLGKENLLKEVSNALD